MGDATTNLVSPWDVPTYTAAEAGRLVRLQASRVRRWLKGYEYSVPDHGASTSRRVRQVPVIHRGDIDAPYASFLDLIDLLFVKKFLEPECRCRSYGERWKKLTV